MQMQLGGTVILSPLRGHPDLFGVRVGLPFWSALDPIEKTEFEDIVVKFFGTDMRASGVGRAIESMLMIEDRQRAMGIDVEPFWYLTFKHPDPPPVGSTLRFTME